MSSNVEIIKVFGLYVISLAISVVLAVILGFILTIFFGFFCKDCGLGALAIPFMAFPFSLMTAYPLSYWIVRRKMLREDDSIITLQPIKELVFYYLTFFISLELSLIVLLIGLLYYLGVDGTLLTLIEFPLFPIIFIVTFYYLTRKILFNINSQTFLILSIIATPG